MARERSQSNRRRRRARRRPGPVIDVRGHRPYTPATFGRTSRSGGRSRLPEFPMHASRLASLAFVGLLSSAAMGQFQPWQMVGGTFNLRFEQAGLSGAGLQLADVDQTGPTPGAVGADGAVIDLQVGFLPDLMVLQGHEGEYVAFGVLGGGAPLTGGFTLVSPSTGTAVDFHEPRFHFLPTPTDGPGGAPENDYLYLSSQD